LSLAGRITIAKTFLIQQINHLGCILLPDPDRLNQLQHAIDNFCVGKLNVAKDRLYTEPKNGGIGLIKLDFFLIAQHVNWIRRAHESTRDNWRVDLCARGFSNCFAIHPKMFNASSNPILKGLAASWQKFLCEFYRIEKNVYESYILNNPFITRSGTDLELLDEKFWSGSVYADMYKVAWLKLKHCFSPTGNFLSYDEFRVLNNIQITPITYIRLISALENFKRNYKPHLTTGTATSLEIFFSGTLKGSKRNRNILMTTLNFRCNKVMSCAENFSRVAGLQLPVDPGLDPDADPGPDWTALSLWAYSLLPNDFREFLYKFYFNKLGVNDRVANFADIGKQCTFCEIVAGGLAPVENESFAHLFLHCPSVVYVHDVIDNVFDFDVNNLHHYKLRWLGLKNKDEFFKIFYLLVQFQVWKCKLNHNVPNPQYCLGEAFYELDNFIRVREKVLLKFINSDSVLFRLWTRVRMARW
jgi:hypothetical protein